MAHRPLGKGLLLLPLKMYVELCNYTLKFNTALPWSTRKGTDDGIVTRAKTELLLGREVSSGLRAIDCQLLYDLAISIHGEDECAKAERLLLNIEGLCVKVHPLELTKLPIWSILAFTGKSSFSKILNNALRKKNHEFPCCRAVWFGDFSTMIQSAICLQPFEVGAMKFKI
ncbi:hypothetical protein GOP47_0027797 [Adiantum capillus-veneris]|nr:hypothetical protein GOP47_0027797 [Adiantum capillus-veneris]